MALEKKINETLTRICIYFDCYEVLCGGQDIIDILEQHIIEDLEEEANQIIEAL